MAGRGSPGRDRLALLAFLISLAAYYFLCRRLSLAFEWAFLTGFPFALPMVILARNATRTPGWKSFLIERFWIAMAPTVFYWVGALLIMWKY